MKFFYYRVINLKWGKVKAYLSLVTQDRSNLKVANDRKLPDIYFFGFASPEMGNRSSKENVTIILMDYLQALKNCFLILCQARFSDMKMS